MVQWSRGQLLPYGPIEILPGARALHFAEQAFEGMKAYRVGRPVANLFPRRAITMQRFKRSAERVAMTPVPEALFLRGDSGRGGRLHAVCTRPVRPVAVPAALPVRN